MSAPTIVEVQGRKLKLTNLDKVLYPATGFTKGQVADYYVRIAPYLVPHLAGRALTMKRYPEEIFLVDSFGIALHGERSSGEMRHQIGRNADVIIRHLSLGEPGSGIEDLVKIRELKLAALHFDDGGSRHG